MYVHITSIMSTHWYLLFSVGAWSLDPREKDIGRVCQRNAHDVTEAVVKALYATSLSPEETQAYIEACQSNLKDPDLKANHTWLVPLGFFLMP